MDEISGCEQHNRALEGLCKDCEVLVCASCVLFGPHQKHSIVSLKEGADYLRDHINDEMKEGKLKKEYSENRLLEVREYLLRLEKFKNVTVRKVDETFKKIITTLKNRKNQLIADVLDKFNAEKESVLNQEDNWIDKQNISEKLLQLMSDSDDQQILANSKFIADGIRRLNEELFFRKVQVHNGLDTALKIQRDKGEELVLSFEELLSYLSQYLTMSEPNILEFKA